MKTLAYFFNSSALFCSSVYLYTCFIKNWF